MPKYSRNVSLPGKSAQEIYDRVASDIEGFLSKTPIGKHEIERDASGRKVRFKSAMASATLDQAAKRARAAAERHTTQPML